MGSALAQAQPMQDPSHSGFFILQRMSPHDFTHPSNPSGHILISAFLPHYLTNTYDQQVLEQTPHLHVILARHSIHLRGDSRRNSSRFKTATFMPCTLLTGILTNSKKRLQMIHQKLFLYKMTRDTYSASRN